MEGEFWFRWVVRDWFFILFFPPLGLFVPRASCFSKACWTCLLPCGLEEREAMQLIPPWEAEIEDNFSFFNWHVSGSHWGCFPHSKIGGPQSWIRFQLARLLDSRRQIYFWHYWTWNLVLNRNGGKAILGRTLNIHFAYLSCTSSLYPPPGLSDFVLAYLGRAFRAHIFGSTSLTRVLSLLRKAIFLIRTVGHWIIALCLAVAFFFFFSLLSFRKRKERRIG